MSTLTTANYQRQTIHPVGLPNNQRRRRRRRPHMVHANRNAFDPAIPKTVIFNQHQISGDQSLSVISHESKMMLKTIVVLGVVALGMALEVDKVEKEGNTQVVAVSGDGAPLVRQKRLIGLFGAKAALGVGALAAGGLLAKGALLG